MVLETNFKIEWGRKCAVFVVICVAEKREIIRGEESSNAKRGNREHAGPSVAVFCSAATLLSDCVLLSTSLATHA